MLYFVHYMNLIIIQKWEFWLLSFSLATALSRFQTVLDCCDNFTLISIFRPKAIIKKKLALQCQLQDGGTETT